MPETTYYTSCLRIQRVDGFVICLTELDKDLTILDSDIDIDGGEEQIYLSAAGYTPTNMQSTSDNAVNNADVEGVLSAVGVQREDIIGGRYDFAKLHIFLWDWKNNVLVKKLGSGHWGEVTIKDGSYVAEFRSLSQQLQQTIGRTYNPECDEQLGGPRCQLNVADFTQNYIVSGISGDTIQVTNDLADVVIASEVTTSGSKTVFTDNTLGQDDDYYNGYSIKFTAGNNIGETAIIETQTATGVITLTESVTNTIIATDQYNIYYNSSTNVILTESVLIQTHVPTSVVSTSEFNDDTLTEVDDYYNDKIVRFTSGNNSGEERVILDYTQTGGNIVVVSAFTNTILVTDEYDIYEMVIGDIGINAYAYGKLLFTSGNADPDGNKNHDIHMEVKTSTVNEFNLFLPMPFEIIIGDTFDVYYGCDKRLTICKDKFNNHINFQGFPYIPGVDQISKFGGQ